MNWLDWTLAAILAAGAFGGFRAGFVRLVIGLVAFLLAFVLAAWFHGLAGTWVEPVTGRGIAASVSGYLIVFFGVILLGSLTATGIQKFFKLVGLSMVDRLLGAGFGLVRTALGIAAVAMLAMAFFPGRMPGLKGSVIAPYFLSASKAMSAIAPYDIRSGVERTYATLRDQLRRYRPGPSLTVREE